MDKFILALQIQNPDGFKAIFGTSTVSVAQEDIIEGFRDIAGKLLMHYSIESDVMSPSFGIWYVLFRFKQAVPEGDAIKQLETFTLNGKKLTRMLLQDNFGMSTGTNIKFKFAVIPAPPGNANYSRLNYYVRKNLDLYPVVGKPHVEVTRDEFVKTLDPRNIDLYLQPVIALPRESIIGYEVLSRGPENSPIRGAAEFFGTASHFGLREELEMVCIAKAFDWCVKLPEPYWISINIGPDLLLKPYFYDFITQRHLKDILPRIVLELTEHFPIQISEKLKSIIHDLKEMGIGLALDDTGCGFADISAVQMLRPKIVKLCITITRRIGRNPYIEKDIRNIVNIINHLGGNVLSEGVEQSWQVSILKESGVSLLQGYYYGYPERIENLINA